MTQENAKLPLSAEMLAAFTGVHSTNKTEQMEAVITLLEPIYDKLTPTQLTVIQCRMDKCGPFEKSVSAAIFFLVICVILISSLGIFRPYLGNTKNAVLRRSCMVIIALAPFFAMLSFFSFTFPAYHDFYEIGGNYMEALAIFSFYRILVYLLGGEDVCADFLTHGVTQSSGTKEELLAPHGDALTCICFRIRCFKFKDGTSRMRWTRILVAQIIIFRTGFLAANAFVRFFLKDKGLQKELQLLVLIFSILSVVSFVIAMISLLQFYLVVRKPFAVVYNASKHIVKNLKWKFLLMKALLSLIVVQNFVVNSLIRFNDGLANVRHRHGNVEQRFVQLIAVITIVEMAIFSIFLRIIFDPLQHGSIEFKNAHKAYLEMMNDEGEDESRSGRTTSMEDIELSEISMSDIAEEQLKPVLSKKRQPKRIMNMIATELFCPLIHLAKPMLLDKYIP